LKTQAPDNSSVIARRICAIRASLRCFWLSLPGLVPVLGIPFCIAAIIQFRKVRKIAGMDWNPASKYLKAARIIGTAGILGTILFLTFTFGVLPTLRDISSCTSGSS
jgi:hypothetical protein